MVKNLKVILWVECECLLEGEVTSGGGVMATNKEINLETYLF